MARYASTTLRAIVAIILAILIANSAFVFFGYESSPIWWTAGVTSRTCAWTCGLPTVDPNVGFITQPLGHLAALNLLHGHLPWWNYFEGVGQPLAGEMQSAALLPLVILFIFPAGLLLFHLSLQFIAGVSTYFLIRRLGVGATIATLGGILFALNGTFAWIGNAAINPIAFMPMLLLGVELVLAATAASRRAGWVVLALAVALSIYAGFPEMAYLDGLLAVGWTITRLFSLERPRRRDALGRIAIGGVVGFALAAPIIVAFFDYVKDANVGAHAAKGLALATTSPSTLPILVNPYLGGALFGGSPSTPNNLLGYVTASVAVFAVVGVIGRRLRPLRFFLAGWVVAVLAGVLNILFIRQIWNLIPDMREIAYARYIWPTVEMAVIVLAVLGLSDLVEYAVERNRAKWATLGVAAVAVAGVFLIKPLGGLVGGSIKTAVLLLIVVPFVALAVIGYSLQFLKGTSVLRAVVAVMLFESVVFFAVPTYRSPSQITVDFGSINYLQANQGLTRFLSLGVLNPNWGSQFGLNEVNAIDLPAPVSFTNYVKANLAPTIKNPRIFSLPFTQANEDEVAAHVSDFEAIGVGFLLVPDHPISASLRAAGLTLVTHDSNSALYRFPDPTAFYTTSLSTCTISAATVDHVIVNCPSATTLTRRELSMSGWSAHVDGRATPITSDDGLTQTIALPAGVSTVAYDFLPPHEDLAGLAALLGLFAVVATWMPGSVLRRRRPRRRNGPAQSPPPPEVETTETPDLEHVGETE